jgi:integrase
MAKKPKAIKGVYEREPGSNVWCIRYALNGKLKREVIGTRAQAVQAYQDRKTAIRRGEKLPTREKGITFRDLAAQGILWKQNNKPRSAKQDARNLAVFIEEFGDRPANAISRGEFEQFLEEIQHEREITGATVNRYLSSLQMVYREGMHKGVVDHNPASGIRRKEEGMVVPRFLTLKEQELIIAELRDRHLITEFLFAIYTGVRRGEQYRLKWSDVDLLEGRAFIRYPKNGESRFVEIHSKLNPLLRALPRNSSGLVFARGASMASNHHMRWFEDAVKRSGIAHCRWHDLRHTCASRLVQNGVDIYRVMQIMGHKTMKTTMRYAHLRREDIRTAIETLHMPEGNKVEERITVN